MEINVLLKKIPLILTTKKSSWDMPSRPSHEPTETQLVTERGLVVRIFNLFFQN